jgi:hypothetical protein
MGDSMRSFDSFAAEMIPIRLLISIAIVTAIAVLVGVGMGTLHTSLAQHQVEQQCRDLVSSLETMVRSGAPRDLEEGLKAAGTMRIQTLILPDNLVYLCFGGDPDAKNMGVLHPQVSEDGAVIVYKVQGGSKQIIWLPRGMYGFREGYLSNTTWTLKGDGESFILVRGGTSTLVFELVEKNQKIYILIHGNDGIE